MLSQGRAKRTGWSELVEAVIWVLLCAAIVMAVFSDTAQAQHIPHAANSYKSTLIRTARAEMGMQAPIATLAGQVHQESGWRPSVVSHAGAQGVAQFMPATARWMAKINSDLTPAKPFNPSWALRAMVRYNAWHLQRIQASGLCEKWAFALSAYNGGLGWVYKDKRLAQASGACELAWFSHVERFNAGRSANNFHENRNYVRNILTRWELLYSTWGDGVCGVAL